MKGGDRVGGGGRWRSRETLKIETEKIATRNSEGMARGMGERNLWGLGRKGLTCLSSAPDLLVSKPHA